jgi:ribosomal protein L11 methyltransferase
VDEMDRYVELLKDDGWLLLSGFYEHDNEDIISFVEPLGPKFFRTETKNDWSVLVFKK